MDQTQTTGNNGVGDAGQQQTNQVQNATAVDTTVAQALTDTTSAASQQVPAQIPNDEVKGLRQAAEAERKKRQDLESQLAQNQILLSQLASQVRAPAQQPQQPEDPIGFTDQDLLDPAKVRQAILKVRQDAINAANQSVSELRFRMQYPDYDQLVGTKHPVTGQFVPSEIMQDAFKEDPKLETELLQLGPQAAPLVAYKIALMQKRARENRSANADAATQVQAQQAQDQLAARSAANTAAALTAPMSPSAVSGAPANSLQPDYMGMARTNPKGFAEVVNQILRGQTTM